MNQATSTVITTNQRCGIAFGTKGSACRPGLVADDPPRQDQGMAADGWFWRIPAWIYIVLLAACMVLSLAAGLRGHTSTAVWFAILAALNGWTLYRRRAVHHPPNQPYDLVQMRRSALVWALGLIGFGLATEAGAIGLAVRSSGSDRFGWILVVVVMFGVLVSLIRKTVIFIRGLTDGANMLIVQEDDPDPGASSADHRP